MKHTSEVEKKTVRVAFKHLSREATHIPADNLKTTLPLLSSVFPMTEGAPCVQGEE
jgi:hypothetical protein